ncbi:hypothetical protein AMECASPLE_038258 [Ameca splendens]|uniref:Uncharacterized protein n=1 Tax=Ameca splendens TaxID=208324 RepID=A0ABV0Y848_9TELE
MAHFLLEGGTDTVVSPWCFEHLRGGHLPREREVRIILRAQLGQSSHPQRMGHETRIHAGVLRQRLHQVIMSKAGRAQVMAIVCLKHSPTIHAAVGAIHVQDCVRIIFDY